MIVGGPVGVQPRAQRLTTLNLIRRVPLFSQLTERQADIVAERIVIRRFSQGQTVVEQGTQEKMLFILLNGRARVLASNASMQEVFLAELGAGDYFGEMSLIDNEPHSATVRVERTADMLVLAHKDFARCLLHKSSLPYALMRGLVGRLRGANRQITSLALMDVSGRVARMLLEMAETIDGVTFVRQRVSRTSLAKSVGASREMVSRVMRQLEEQELISTRDDGSLVIRGALV